MPFTGVSAFLGEKMTLERFFEENRRVALAFSGGTDSALLLSLASKFCERVTAYYASTAFQPEFEHEDARRLAKELGAELKFINFNPLENEQIRKNGADRCYHCKNAIFSAIVSAAKADGYELVIDGTNASDAEDDRPGMRALRELGIRSPLRECGITKPQVRQLSRELGLFTSAKPAYACLATRIPTDTEITQEALIRVEKCETALKTLGFSDFRIRMRGESALLQLRFEEMPLAIEKSAEILAALKPWFNEVQLDLKARTPSL